MTDGVPILLDVPAVCAALSISRASWYRAAPRMLAGDPDTGRPALRVVRIGRSVRIEANSLRRIVEWAAKREETL